MPLTAAAEVEVMITTCRVVAAVDAMIPMTIITNTITATIVPERVLEAAVLPLLWYYG